MFSKRCTNRKYSKIKTADEVKEESFKIENSKWYMDAIAFCSSMCQPTTP